MKTVFIAKGKILMGILGLVGLGILLQGFWQDGWIKSLSTPAASKNLSLYRATIKESRKVNKIPRITSQNSNDIHTINNNKVELQIPSRKDFFTEYRLERDRTRSQQMDLMKEIINNPNTSEDTKKEAQNRLLMISNNLEKEMELENLIRAKNFKDAIVFIQEKSVTIIVKTERLEPYEIEKISDLAVRTTEMSKENIVIIPKP